MSNEIDLMTLTHSVLIIPITGRFLCLGLVMQQSIPDPKSVVCQTHVLQPQN